jgi:antitoxin VapB
MSMIDLSQETETLARRLAEAQHISLDDAVREALEERARAKGVTLEARRPRRRLTVDQILAVGDEIAAMPLLDTRSPREIMDDINAL